MFVYQFAHPYVGTRLSLFLNVGTCIGPCRNSYTPLILRSTNNSIKPIFNPVPGMRMCLQKFHFSFVLHIWLHVQFFLYFFWIFVRFSVYLLLYAFLCFDISAWVLGADFLSYYGYLSLDMKNSNFLCFLCHFKVFSFLLLCSFRAYLLNILMLFTDYYSFLFSL